MHKVLRALGVCLLLGACAHREHFLPAVPAPPDGPAMWLPLGEEHVPAAPLPAVESPVTHVEVSSVPVVVPTKEEWSQFVDAQAPKAPQPPAEPPEKTVLRATKMATMSPSRQGFANDASMMQHYPYKPGVLYEIYTSPLVSTAVYIPMGERLASAPLINPDAWELLLVEMGEGPQYQQALVLRPNAPGHDMTIHLFTMSGLRFSCRIRSFEKTAMVAVSWLVPTIRPVLVREAPKEEPPPPKPHFQPPMIDHSRLHTHYTLSYDTDHMPPWVPLGVFDDGQRTIVRFKEPLDYTMAPVLMAMHADGKPGIVQYTPYQVPGQPERGAFYVAQGLWPALALKGTDGYEVRIVRQP